MGRRRALALSAVGAALALALPSPAGAATVSRSGSDLLVDASAGETNLLSVAEAPAPHLPGSLAIRDGGGSPLRSPDCPAMSDGSLVCPAPAGGGLDVELGDRDDRLTVAAQVTASASGGDGDDTLDLRDAVSGGAWCGPGRDTVRADVLDSVEFSCEAVDYGPPGGTGRVRARRGGGRFVAIPAQPWATIDRRLVANVQYLVRRYRVRITEAYALAGHTFFGEHPLGLAVDIVPGPGGSWADVGRLARWAEPLQNRPRAPFRWVGYNGDYYHGDPSHCPPRHGCPPHLHLSWAHSPVRPGRPAGTVWVFDLQLGDP